MQNKPDILRNKFSVIQNTPHKLAFQKQTNKNRLKVKEVCSVSSSRVEIEPDILVGLFNDVKFKFHQKRQTYNLKNREVAAG